MMLARRAAQGARRRYVAVAIDSEGPQSEERK
jgi:hypothetical protein